MGFLLKMALDLVLWIKAGALVGPIQNTGLVLVLVLLSAKPIKIPKGMAIATLGFILIGLVKQENMAQMVQATSK